MNKSKNVPKIRFEGFSGEWENRKVCDIANRFDNLRIPVAANLRVPGSTPYYGANGIQDYVEGYTHEGEFVLVAEDGANDLKNYPVKHVKGRIWVNNHAHVLQAKVNIADNQFLKFCIIKSDVESLLVGGGRSKLNAETMMDITLMIPSIEEQRLIGDYIAILEDLITFHQQKYEKLLNLKKSLLYKLFPKEGETVPELRFEGFSGKWEKKKLGNCFSERTESYPEGELLSVTINQGIKKFSELDRKNNSNDNKSKYKKVYVGDIAYNSMRMWQGASGYSAYKGIVSPAYTVLSPNDLMDSKCFSYLFKRTDIIHMFQIYSKGITSDNWNLKYPDFKELEVYVSQDYNEQKAIGQYFSKLDKLIELNKEKLEKLKNVKESLLDKMFV